MGSNTLISIIVHLRIFFPDSDPMGFIIKKNHHLVQICLLKTTEHEANTLPQSNSQRCLESQKSWVLPSCSQMFISIWFRGRGFPWKPILKQIEIILQGAGSNKKSLLQSTVQFQYFIFTFTVSSPKKTHLQRIRPPNQDYIYAPCPVYIHLTTKKHCFFLVSGKNPSPKKNPHVFMASLNFQGCQALPPTAVGSPERPWRCLSFGGFFFQVRTIVDPGKSYCWWLKSCTSWYGKYPIVYRVLYIPGGAGFQPSTVCMLLGDYIRKHLK